MRSLPLATQAASKVTVQQQEQVARSVIAHQQRIAPRRAPRDHAADEAQRRLVDRLATVRERRKSSDDAV